MPKRSLRLHLLARRRAMQHQNWAKSSTQAQERLLSLPEFLAADCIALYAPAHNETDTALILVTALAAGKRVLYPATRGHQMVFRQVQGMECLNRGSFGILEPRPTGQDFQADEPDLIVVPGVAFDGNGHRIGYGKGFYDRFLDHSDRRADLVGLCHDFQVVETPIPSEAHDIAVSIIVTDRRIIRPAVPCVAPEQGMVGDASPVAGKWK